MKRFLAVSLLVFMALLLCVTSRVLAAPAKDKVLLRLKLQKGQRYVTRFSAYNTFVITETDYSTAMIPQHQSMKVTLDTRVLAVAPNGNVTLQMKIIATQVTTDFDYPHSPVPLSKIFHAMFGLPLIVQKTPSGKLLSIKGIEPMIRRTISAIPRRDRRSRAQKREARETVLILFNPTQFQNFGQDSYPPQAVEVGKTWRARLAMGGCIFPVNTEYRLAKRDKNFSTIAARGDFKEPTVKDTFTDGSGSMTRKTSGSQTMQMQVEEKTGLVRSLDGTVRVEEAQTMTEGKTSNTSLLIMTSHIHMTISDR